MAFKRFRSAITGRFIRAVDAVNHARTTVAETVKRVAKGKA